MQLTISQDVLREIRSNTLEDMTETTNGITKHDLIQFYSKIEALDTYDEYYLWVHRQIFCTPITNTNQTRWITQRKRIESIVFLIHASMNLFS